MARRGKSLAVTDALIDDVLSLEYGRPRTFAVLAALFPHVDTRNQFHVDHIFPSALLDPKALNRQVNEDGELAFSPSQVDELAELKNQLPNLELLPGLENIGKLAATPAAWLSDKYPSPEERASFLDRNALPSTLPSSAEEFIAFFDKRRSNLEARIVKMLTPTTPIPGGASQTSSDLDEELVEGDDTD
jgi:hypothetical protein